MIEFYRAIWAFSWKRQIVLIALSIALSLLAAAPLELQKDIINHVVEDTDAQVLLWLALGFMAVTALSAGLKLVIQFISASLGEDTIREIRNRIYGRLVEFHGMGSDPSEPTAPGTGTAVTMISSEAEQIGVFAGDSITLPLLQLGTLLTVLVYIAAQSAILGIIVAAVVIPQGLATFLTQSRINALVRARVAALREGTDRIARSDLQAIEQETEACFDRIYEARVGIFRVKLTTKFVMNLLNGAGMTAILLIGGWYVIQGVTDVGTITVAMTGLARAVQPWRDLMMFYRRAGMVLVRYEVLRDTFPHTIPNRPAAAPKGA